MSTSHSDPAPSVGALYFDGRSARAHAVTLTLHGAVLCLRGAGVSRDDELAAVRLSEPMGQAARLISFADGAHAEVRDHVALARVLAASGQRDAVIVRWTRDSRRVLLALGALLVSIWLAWQYGLPWVARVAAPGIPDALVRSMSEQALCWVDEHLMTPSTLDRQRQQAIRAALRPLAFVDGQPVRHALLFRSGGRMGANAFALPDGTLIVTDELVALARDDDDVLAVLAHELGHVHERHGVRMLLQGSATALFMAWYIGDVSSLLATGPTVLVQAGYSRGMETEADDFASRALRARGRSPALLADMLERLMAAHGRDNAADNGFQGWFSSHPDTASRILRLRAGDFGVH